MDIVRLPLPLYVFVGIIKGAATKKDGSLEKGFDDMQNELREYQRKIPFLLTPLEKSIAETIDGIKTQTEYDEFMNNFNISKWQ